MKCKLTVYLFTLFVLINISPNISQAQYYYNNAFNFTGAVGTYAATDPGPALALTGSFTLECWAKATNWASPVNQILFQKRLGSAQSGYALYTNASKLAVRTNQTTRLTGTTILQSNVWYHLAATYNSTTNAFTLYINGIQEAANVTLNAAPAADADSVRIASGFNSPFGGLIDEIRIWNVERTSLEILSCMKMSLGETSGFYPGLVGSWRGNNVSGGSGVEEINGYTAHLRGAASFTNVGNNPNASPITFNTGLYCPGASFNYLSVPNSPAVSPSSAVTFEMWINANNTTTEGIIGKGTIAPYPFRIVKSVGSTFRAFIASTGIGSGNYGGIIPTQQWTHLAFTYNAANGAYAYYMNGVQTQAGTQTVTGNAIPQNSDSLTIGGGAGFTCLTGILDEVRVSNYVKSLQDIQKGMFVSIDKNNEPIPSNFTAAYSFEGTADSYCDSTTGFLNGTQIRFSRVANNTPEMSSPIDRYDAVNFPNGFRIQPANIAFGNSPVSVRDSFYFSQSMTISDMNVFIGINHAFGNDVAVTIASPTGATCNLTTGATANIGTSLITIFDDQADSSITPTLPAPFSPRVKPMNALTVFNGQNSAGWWKIIVTDIFPAASDGFVKGWGINFNNSTLTGTGNEITSAPEKYSLSQNYPNPFNPVTNIVYNLSFDSKVHIKVFDIAGREVVTLVNSVQNAGSHSVQFNGTNLTSGIYFYTITAENKGSRFVDTKKMILVK